MSFTKKQRAEVEKSQTIEEEVQEKLDALNLDTGQWIMVTRELHLHKNPPVMSIHWSHPWPMDKGSVVAQALREEAPLAFGREHNLLTARKIEWDGEHIRIFEDEYSIVKGENLKLYVLGIPDMNEPPTHELRPGGLSERNLIVDIMEGDKRLVYDAALVDGCTPSQAFRVAMGLEVLDEVDFPPIGWYECSKEVIGTFFPNTIGQQISLGSLKLVLKEPKDQKPIVKKKVKVRLLPGVLQKARRNK